MEVRNLPSAQKIGLAGISGAVAGAGLAIVVSKLLEKESPQISSGKFLVPLGKALWQGFLELEHKEAFLTTTQKEIVIRSLDLASLLITQVPKSTELKGKNDANKTNQQ